MYVSLPPLSRYPHRLEGLILLLVVLLWLGGCATSTTALHDSHTATRQRIVRSAEQLIGTPYALGGDSPAGMDCSGLVQYVYSKAGVRVPRTTLQQFQAGRTQAKVLPGDLVFFHTTSSGTVSHVGIYAGNGQMIHASSGSGRVQKIRLNQPYWQQRWVGGATYLGTARPSRVGRWFGTDGPSS